jgi:hypothetical protein
MRKFLAMIVGVAMVVAACGGSETGDDTTTEPTESPDTTQSPDTTAPDTTAAAGPTTTLADGTPFNDCFGSNQNHISEGVTCADYAKNVESPLVEDDGSVIELQVPFALQLAPDRPMCMVTNEILTYPAIEDPLPDTIAPADQTVFENLDPWFEAVQLGYYTVADGADMFTVIGDLEDDYEVQASPHYIMAPAQIWKYGPAGIANEFGGSWKDLEDNQIVDPDLGGGRVVIIDTGGVADDLDDNSRPALNVQSADSEPGGLDLIVEGHGQFAASIVNRYNPRLTIEIRSASFEIDGLAYLTELGVVDAIGRAEPGDGEVVNMSLGGYPCRTDDPFIGMAVGLSIMPHEVTSTDAGSGQATDISELSVTFVAASGNDGEPYAMYPAQLAFDKLDMILGSPPDSELGELIEQLGGFSGIQPPVWAVGAADANGDRAVFSNEAQVYVPGVDVVGWYEPGQGLAAWSGTSFAAPRFAACVASGACPP